MSFKYSEIVKDNPDTFKYLMYEPEIDRFNITVDPKSSIDFQLNMNLYGFQKGPDGDYSLNQGDQEPIFYKIESIKSNIEEKVKLTAPLFCKIVPYTNNFTVMN